MNNVYKEQKTLVSQHFQWPKKASNILIELQSKNVPFSYGRPKTNNPFLKYPLGLKTRRVPVNTNEAPFSNSLCSPKECLKELNTSAIEIKNQCNPCVHRRQQSVNQEEKLRFICDKKLEDCKISNKRVILPGISCKVAHCTNISMATYDKRNDTSHKLSVPYRRGSIERDQHKDNLSFNFNDEKEVGSRLNIPRFSCVQTNREITKLIHNIAFNKVSMDKGANSIRCKQFAGKYALRHRVRGKQTKSQIENPIIKNEVEEKIVSNRGLADIVKHFGELTSSDSTCSFSGKDKRKHNNVDKTMDYCSKSPTFDLSFIEDNGIVNNDQIQEKSGSKSPRSKKEIIKLFSIPKSAKKKKLSMYLFARKEAQINNISVQKY